MEPVDGEPNLDLYELTRFLVWSRTGLCIALDGAVKTRRCHRVGPEFPNWESEAIRRTINPTLSQTGVITIDYIVIG